MAAFLHNKSWKYQTRKIVFGGDLSAIQNAPLTPHTSSVPHWPSQYYYRINIWKALDPNSKSGMTRCTAFWTIMTRLENSALAPSLIKVRVQRSAPESLKHQTVDTLFQLPRDEGIQVIWMMHWYSQWWCWIKWNQRREMLKSSDRVNEAQSVYSRTPRQIHDCNDTNSAHRNHNSLVSCITVEVHIVPPRIVNCWKKATEYFYIHNSLVSCTTLWVPVLSPARDSCWNKGSDLY